MCAASACTSPSGGKPGPSQEDGDDLVELERPACGAEPIVLDLAGNPLVPAGFRLFE